MIVITRLVTAGSDASGECMDKVWSKSALTGLFLTSAWSFGWLYHGVLALLA